jgi:hypothetical protein
VSSARDVIEQLDGWVNSLAKPFVPPRLVHQADGVIRLQFAHHVPHALLVGKLVRAVSGLRAALLLAEAGYVAECAALLRMVSDFGTEVKAVAEALNRGGEPPRAVRDFFNQYFTPKARTPEEYASAERIRYVSREELLKADVRLAEGTLVDVDQLQALRRFLNMAYDSYVHGGYETTMEMCNPSSGEFMMRGHPDPGKRAEFVEAVLSKLHEVVVAIQLTAAVCGQSEVFEASRQAGRELTPSTDGLTRLAADGGV